MFQSLCANTPSPRVQLFKGNSPRRIAPTSEDEYGFLPWKRGQLTRPSTQPKMGVGGYSENHSVNSSVYENLPVDRTPQTAFDQHLKPSYDVVKRNDKNRVSFGPNQQRVYDPHAKKKWTPRLSRSASVMTPTRHNQSQRINNSTVMSPIKRSSSHKLASASHENAYSDQKTSSKQTPEIQESEIISFPENTPMVIVESYDPTGDLAIAETSLVSVKKGEIVNAVSKRGHWLLVRTYSGHFGYIPLKCADAIKVILRKCKQDFSQQFPEDGQPLSVPKYDDSSSCHDTSIDLGFESFGSSSPSTDLADDFKDVLRIQNRAPRQRNPLCVPNAKDHNYLPEDHLGHLPKLTVLFDYQGANNDDVSVRHQDIVILLDESDQYWILVRTPDGSIGYIPKSYAIDLTSFNLDPFAKTTYL